MSERCRIPGCRHAAGLADNEIDRLRLCICHAVAWKRSPERHRLRASQDPTVARAAMVDFLIRVELEERHR
jgi:hypothetical protein